MSRRKRQHDEIMSALMRRQYLRVLVLSREHLAEFPDEVDVRVAAAQVQRHHARDGARDEEA